MEKKFSILIPVYNVEKYLRQCIDSVLMQNYLNIEIVLVDDGSTDNSGKICDEYAAKDSRIKVIHKENEGLLLARRTAIKDATGDYLMFLDSDDYWELGLLDKIKNTIEKYGCDMVIFRYKAIYENKTEERVKLFDNNRVFEGDEKITLYKMLIESTAINNLVTKVVKKSIVDVDNDYRSMSDVTYAEDALQSTQLLLNAKKIVYIDDAMYCYRQQTGMTKKTSALALYSVTKVREKITQVFKDTGLDLNDSIEKEFFNYLKNFEKDVLYGYIDNPDLLKESCEYVFNTEFYKMAKKTAYKKQSCFNKAIIWLAEKNHYKLIGVLSLSLKIRNRIKDAR